MRQRVKADRVFWILPAGNLKASEVPILKIQTLVKSLAKKYGDTIIPINSLQNDKIHPSWNGYKTIVENIK